MSELTARVNIRINADMNMSISVSSVVQDAAEADEAAKHDAEIVMTYLKSYGAKIEEMGTT